MPNNIPENQTPDFLQHLKTLNEHFQFLISEFGFELKLNDWCSREYTTTYKKENIEVQIIYETSIPSSVCIVNTNLPYNESIHLSNFDYIGQCNPLTAINVRTMLKSKQGVINR